MVRLRRSALEQHAGWYTASLQHPHSRTPAMGSDCLLALLFALKRQLSGALNGLGRRRSIQRVCVNAQFSKRGALPPASSSAGVSYTFVGRGNQGFEVEAGAGKRLGAFLPPERPAMAFQGTWKKLSRKTSFAALFPGVALPFLRLLAQQ